MKVLLTGKPGAGKTTAILKFLEITKRKAAGFYTEAIKDENNARVGFSLVTLDGTRRELAHKQKFLDSPFVIQGKSGGQFYVNGETISSFIVPTLQKALDEKVLIVVDEIGKIQAINPDFLQLVDQIMASDHDLLGTIVYDPKPWADKYKADPDVLLVEVNAENRDELPFMLDTLFANTVKLGELEPLVQSQVLALTRQYLQESQRLQIEKLYNNALDYLHQPLSRIGKDDEGRLQFEIAGKHDKRIITFDKHTGSYSCTCPLYRGEEPYVGRAGECSHIQTIKILIQSGKKL